jgi:hypothetical protein
MSTMGLFDRLFRRRGALSDARRAELRGDLPRAAELWAEAGRLDEVARIMLLRGDAEPDPRQRLQHFTQAVATAPARSRVAKQARAKRASLTIALAGDGTVSAAMRKDLLEAARDLEEVGEADRAAEAYALVRDTVGEARALVQAGQVERLETLLTAEQSKTSGERLRSQAHGEIETLTMTGRRREALAAAERLTQGATVDPSARERMRGLQARRAAGLCRVILSGRPLNLILDDELVVGRTEGSLVVSSAALSRKHLEIVRADGVVVVRDLGSRNGTLLRGMRLAGALPVGDGLSLLLGGELKLEVGPSPSMQDAVDVEVGGKRYVASLGSALLGVGSWRLERAADEWIELVTDDSPQAFLGDMAMSSRTTLLVGDRMSASRGGPTVFEVVGSSAHGI